MPTTVTSKIGATNTPITMDYTSLQAWEDACPANLVSDDKVWKGECYDQGEFTSSGVQLTINGTTTDATRYLWLTCATGASFRDKAAVRSTPLIYDSTKGVASRTTGNYNRVLSIAVNYTRIEGIQWKETHSAAADVISVGATDVTIDGCIVNGATSGPLIFGSTSKNIIVTNNMLYGVSNTGVYMGTSGGGTPRCIGNTIIRTTTGGTQGVIPGNYSSGVVRNNAIFGFTAAWDGNGVAAGSGNNATDAATAPGSSNQTGLTMSAQFVDHTADWRAVDTGSLDGNATPDTTYMSTDISRTTRDGSAPTIGCWEVVAAAGGFPAALMFDYGQPIEMMIEMLDRIY